MATRKKVETPQWGRTTKMVVIVICLVIIGVLAWRYAGLVGQFVVAAMLAYMLNPSIAWLETHTKLTRGWAVMVVYLLLIVVVLGFAALIGVAFSNQVIALTRRLPEVVKDALGFFTQLRSSSDTIDILGIQIKLATIDWDALEKQAIDAVTPTTLEKGLPAALQAAGDSLNFFGWVTITLLISVYAAIDMPRLGAQLGELAHQSGYRYDFERLARGFNRIWDAYLRGQVILGIIIAVITSAMLAALGVENWLALGLLSGVLQVIPYVGPTVSAALIVLFALFQPANYLGLAPIIYAALVAVVTLVVQQVSGNILLPTVVGDALNMSALAVLVSLIIGFAVAGVMGVILAAPVVASLRLMVTYIWRKLLDLPPFPDKEPPPTQVTLIVQRSKELMQQIRNRRDPSETSGTPGD